MGWLQASRWTGNLWIASAWVPRPVSGCVEGREEVEVTGAEDERVQHLCLQRQTCGAHKSRWTGMRRVGGGREAPVKARNLHLHRKGT